MTKIIKEKGIKKLHKGFYVALIRAFPVNAVTFLSYEWALTKLEKTK